MTQESRRTSYAPPKLVVYGDVRDITRDVGNKSNVDDGAKTGPSKTN